MIWFFVLMLGLGLLSGLSSGRRHYAPDYNDDRYPEPEYDYDGGGDCGGCDGDS